MAKSKSTGFKKQTFSSSHLIIVALAFGIIGGIIGWAVSHAAPRSKDGGSGTISIAMVTDKNGDGLPNYGDTVTFKVSTTSTTQPMVELDCYQSGILVYQSWKSWSQYNTDRNFTLGGTTPWQSSVAANCTAHLQNWDSYSKNGRITEITSTTFVVNP